MKVFIVLNPLAGGIDPRVREVLDRYIERAGWNAELYEMDGEEDVVEVVRSAYDRGFERFVAAGGDGTVSAVAGGVVGTEAAVGVLPLGTGNTLAQDLGIPLDPTAALDLLAEDHTILRIDAMEVGGRYYVLNVSVGLSARLMRDTRQADKRRFGRLAYIWNMIFQLLGFQPYRFELEIDGERQRLRASDVVVANSGALGEPTFRWAPEVRMDDGRLNVSVVRARSIVDYLNVAWSVLLRRHEREPAMRFFVVEQEIRIDSDHVLSVQADGEVIGHTPVHVEAVSGAVHVIVPRQVGGEAGA